LEILEGQNRRFCHTDHDACKYLSQEKGGDTLSRVAGWSCWIAACDLEGSPLKTIMSGRMCFYYAQTT
jgi:hypothetical protein